jgi:hypothetical protein
MGSGAIDEVGSAPEGAERSGAPRPPGGAAAPAGGPSGPLWLRFLKLFSDLVNPVNIAILAGLAVIAVTGAFGGWRAAEEDPEALAVVEEGAPASADPFAITIQEAFWTADSAPLGWQPEDTVSLVVRAHVESSFDAPVPVSQLCQSVVAIMPGVEAAAGQASQAEGLGAAEDSGSEGSAGSSEGQSGLAGDGAGQSQRPGGGVPAGLVPWAAYRVVDGAHERAVQPGIPQDYWLVWQIPADSPQPDALRIVHTRATWRASSLDGGMFWADRTAVSTQEIAVAPTGKVD